jgi:Putative transmembrane protein (PGPGW)
MEVSTEPPAKAKLTPWHVARILAGFALLLIGGILAFPGIPGPGIPIVLFGLWLLSRHFHWARRTLAWLSEKTAAFRRKKRDGSAGQ